MDLHESSNLAQLREVLSTDPGDKATALLRLQGWRGPDLEQASGVTLDHRLGPAVCAIGAFAGGLLTSPALLALTAFTAVVGALALSIGFVAAFVAATGICIPSMIFTLMWGSKRATAPTLWEASDVG